MDRLEGILGGYLDNKKFERLREETIKTLRNYRERLEKGKLKEWERDEQIHQVDRLIGIVKSLEPTSKNMKYLEELRWEMGNALDVLKYSTGKPSEGQYSKGIKGYLRKIGEGIYKGLRGIKEAIYERLGDLYYMLSKGFEKVGYRIDDLYKGLKHYFGKFKEWVGEHKSIVARAIMYPSLIAGAMISPIFKALLALVLMGDLPLMMLELETKTGEEIKKHR